MELTYHLGPDDAAEALRADALAGLTATPRELPPRWFYDERGSELFDRITRLPEYYPTRTERAILTAHAAEIAAASGAEVLVELGSGTSEKTRLLLTALREAAQACTVPARFDAALVCHQPGATFALDFATTLRRLAPDLPIILAAPSARDLDAPLLAASGISEVVHHPLTSAELASALSRCLATNPAPQLH